MSNSILNIDELQLTSAAALTLPITYPHRFQSTALDGTAMVGKLEFDGDAFYTSPTGSSRGVSPSVHFIAQVSNRANIANVNTANAIFDAVTNGTITLPADTTYKFDMNFAVSTTGATSRTLGLLFACSNAPTAISYMSICNALAPTGFATVNAASIVRVAVTTVTPINAAAAAASYNVVSVSGILRTNLATTFIPQMQWSAAPGAVSVVQAGSYFMMYPLGSGSVASCGYWS